MSNVQYSEESKRIHNYIASVVVTLVKEQEISLAQAREISQYVLSSTGSLTTKEQVTDFLAELSEKYPVLKQAEVENLAHIEDEDSTSITSQMEELLKSGDVEGAIAVGNEYSE